MTIVKRDVYICLGCLFLVTALGASPVLAQTPEEGKIVQTGKPLNIDGSLDDWTGIEELAVERTPDGRTVAPAADLTVTVRLAFDAENFYAGIKIVDDQLVFPERRLQDGDSFYITLVTPEPTGESRRYSTYGFSLFRNEEIKALVSRDRKANPFSFVKDIQLKIKPAEDKKSVVYEVAIPWRYLPDFRPFLQPVWGINLAYADYDAAASKIVQLLPDAGFMDEHAAVRKGRAFRFVPGEPAAPEFQSRLSANHYFPQDEKTVSLAVHSPSAHSGWQLVMLLSSPEGNVQSKRSLSFDRGRSVLEFPVEIAKPVWGVYDLSLVLLDEQGAIKFSDDKQFFLIQPPQLESVAARLAEIKKGARFAKDEVFRESLPTAEVRLQWIEEFIKTADPHGDIESVRKWDEEIKELVGRLEAGEPALFPPGRAGTLGYRSPLDGSLKSYTVIIPPWYDKSLKFPLAVTLGGGATEAERNVGVLDAVNYGPRVGRRAGDLIFMEPSPELAQNWYAGNAGPEIMAGIEHLKKLYGVNAKAIVLDGFDRGAYGALRWALLNPGVFRGVLLRSGRYVPPDNLPAENLFDLFDRAGNLSIMMVHGAEDEDAPVSEARAVAARLEKLGAGFKYIEVKDGGHSGYDRWTDIFSWLKDLLGGDVVVTKPPRKIREKKGDDSSGAPANHTLDKSGAYHKPGLYEPQSNCVSCHGDDLRGGTAGQSCFSCHDRKW